jgi:hypothetical protein
MKMPGCFVRPDFLVKGQRYLLRLRPKRTRTPTDCARIPVLIEVVFKEYTACPAVVIVHDARQAAIRCKREDLFTSSKSPGDV